MVRAKRTGTRGKGWRPRDVAIILGAIALVLAAGLGLYSRERRLQRQWESDRQRFIREHEQRMMDGMTDAQREEYRRRGEEWNRHFETQQDD